jgi:hypothetical protein
MNLDDDLGIDVLAMPTAMRAKVTDGRSALAAAMPLVPHAPPEALLHIDRLAVHAASADPRDEIAPVGHPLLWRLVDLAILTLLPFGVLGLLLGALVLWCIGLPALLRLVGG